MSGPDFHMVGPFAADLKPSERGDRALKLTKACAGVREAQPALCLLGDPHDPQRRLNALLLLNRLEPLTKRRIISRYMLAMKEE